MAAGASGMVGPRKEHYQAMLGPKSQMQLQPLLEALRITQEQDMPDEARAKLHLAIGTAQAHGITADNLSEDNAGLLEAASEHLTRAIQLHDKCGGKKILEGVTRLLKKYADSNNG